MMRRAFKPLVFGMSLAPLALLAWRTAEGRLGANPIETITHATGDWALRFLLISLAVTPVRHIMGWNALVRFRRMIGLFAFFYASLHLLTYVWLDQFFDWGHMLKDVGKRPFITAGTAAFLALVPLAATSTAAAIRFLGGRRWRNLHRLAYVAAGCAVIHYYWLVKADVRLPLAYGAVLAGLLGFRLARRLASPGPLVKAAPGPTFTEQSS
jgi:sulfoxide reductase heme-binding subunit YedZ